VTGIWLPATFAKASVAKSDRQNLKLETWNLKPETTI